MLEKATAHYIDLIVQGLSPRTAAEHVWHLYGVRVRACR